MKNHYSFPNSLSKKERNLGTGWLILSFLAVPGMLQYALEPMNLTGVQLNFVYYCLNFAVTVWIFRHFLKDSFRTALSRPFAVLWYAALGYLGAQALGELLLIAIYRLLPDFTNVNNDSVVSLLHSDMRIMALSTILLVPPAEELLFRGVLFRGIYDKNPTAAYLVSMGLFAAIHVMGFVGSYEPLHLLLCFLQYLPAGYCLCWCYRQTGTIITPILMHTLVNAISVSQVLR